MMDSNFGNLAYAWPKVSEEYHNYIRAVYAITSQDTKCNTGVILFFFGNGWDEFELVLFTIITQEYDLEGVVHNKIYEQ